MKSIYVFLIAVFTLSACSKSDDDASSTDDRINAENDAAIQHYIENYDLAPQVTYSGLYYSTTLEGTGEMPSDLSNVTISYTGYLLDGTVFDSAEELTTKVSLLITGLSEGITLMKEGGETTFIIPSFLAYGRNGSSIIPSNSVVVFDVKLISVN